MEFNNNKGIKDSEEHKGQKEGKEDKKVKQVQDQENIEEKENKLGKESKEKEEDKETQKQIPINFNVDFKKEEFKFYTPDSKLSLEDLYKSKAKQIIKKSKIFIFFDNYFIPFSNPGFINFIFPDSSTKPIFIANNRNIFKIIDLYPNCKYLVKTDKDKDFKEKNINMLEKYLEIKILLSSEINENEYEKSKLEITLNNQTSLVEISSIYAEYLENKHIIEIGPKYKETEERKEFFGFLENEIKNNNNFIPLCGPEGIGKTTSILAFFKENRSDYFYYYVNLKKIYECCQNGDISRLRKIIIKELYNCIEKLDVLVNKYEKLNSLINEKLNPLDLVTKIIELLDLKRIFIILDQYKTLYDENYLKLKNFINTALSDKGNTIILISSMNEEDVKGSIVSNLKKDNISNLFRLDYIYITSLVSCDKDDTKEFRYESGRTILEKCGNTFYSYYKILEEEINYDKTQKELTFEEFFDKKMCESFEERLKTYYKTESTEKLLKNINYLLKCTGKIPIKEFIEQSELIPFRFFSFTYNNKKIFKISSIDLNSEINLNFQWDKYIAYLLIIYQNLFNKVDLNSNSFITNFISNKESIELEESFSLLLWASRNSKNKIIKDINIKKKVFIQSFFILKENDLNLKDLNKNESILIILIHQNALAFDIGILKYNENGTYSLYLFQVTKLKKSNERLTYISLNDYSNYLIQYFKEIFKIEIVNIYFSYIFDNNKHDEATISECEKNGLDYAILDRKTLSLTKNINPKEYKTKIKVINQMPFKNLKEDATICFDLVQKAKEGTFSKSWDFLNKKRKYVLKIIDIEKKLKKKKNFKENKDKLEISKEQNNIISLKEEDDEKNKSNESKKKKISKKQQQKESLIKKQEEEEKELKEIIDKISNANDYYLKVTNNYRKAYKLEKLDFYTMTYAQREKIISDYLIQKEKAILPGISYQYVNSDLVIETLKNRGLSKEAIESFFNIISKNINGSILAFNKLNSFLPEFYIPEYNSFVLMIRNKEGYYLDYLKRKIIRLLNKEESELVAFDIIHDEFYSFSFIS